MNISSLTLADKADIKPADINAAAFKQGTVENAYGVLIRWAQSQGFWAPFTLKMMEAFAGGEFHFGGTDKTLFLCEGYYFFSVEFINKCAAYAREKASNEILTDTAVDSPGPTDHAPQR